MPIDEDRPPGKPDFQKSPDSFEWYVVQKLDHLDSKVSQLDSKVSQLESTVGRLDNAINGFDGQDGILTRLRVVEQTMATKTWVMAGTLVVFVNSAVVIVTLIKNW